MPPRKQCNVNVEDKKKTRQLKNEPKNNSEKMSQVWSVHEKIFLVQSLLIQLTNIPHVPCNRGLQSIDWSKVRITNRSAAECQSELMSIVNDVKKYRTLREVLEAYNEEESMKQKNACVEVKSQSQQLDSHSDHDEHQSNFTATIPPDSSDKEDDLVDVEFVLTIFLSNDDGLEHCDERAIPSGSGVSQRNNSERPPVKREIQQLHVTDSVDLTKCGRGDQSTKPSGRAPLQQSNLDAIEEESREKYVRGPRKPVTTVLKFEPVSGATRKKTNRDQISTSETTKTEVIIHEHATETQAETKKSKKGATHQVDEEMPASRAPLKRNMKRKQQEKGKTTAAKKKPVPEPFNVSDDD